MTQIERCCSSWSAFVEASWASAQPVLVGASLEDHKNTRVIKMFIAYYAMVEGTCVKTGRLWESQHSISANAA